MAEVMAVLAVVAWWCWTKERDEREEVKHGFDAKERERLQQIVKANMDDPYQRAFRRMAGIRTGVEKWVGQLNSEAKR